jgi:hypothetical protein
MLTKLLFCLLITSNLYASSSNNTNQTIIKLPLLDELIEKEWHSFNLLAGKNLRSFSETSLKFPENQKSVFYPFGGADIVYPILLYPKATDFVLVGLEFAGDWHKFNFNQQKALPKTISLLKRSFFITMQMSKDFSKNDGVLPSLLLQLGMLGVKQVTISDPDIKNKGVKMSFVQDGIDKSVTYYQTNLQNNAFDTGFFEKLHKKMDNFSCFLKSTSYSLHQKGFEKISNFIEQKANSIVQDDSGIPLKKLLQNNFKVQTFGSYQKPYGVEFQGYIQKDLKELTKNSKTKLPFCFGYGCRVGAPRVMVFASKSSESAITKKDQP